MDLRDLFVKNFRCPNIKIARKSHVFLTFISQKSKSCHLQMGGTDRNSIWFRIESTL